MASEGVYGGSEMTLVFQNEGIYPEAFEALLASTSPPYFNGSRSMLSFEGQDRSPPEHSLFRQAEVDETGNDDFDDCFHRPEKKRRLTSNQVKFLEKSFEVENKLEPERKIQIARDVGLQPRQVAVWFQNRRARWKSKQLEKDYEALKTSYDQLKDDHENLVKEKEKLWQEVQVLREKELVFQKGTEAPRHQNDAHHNRQLQGPDLDISTEDPKARELLILGCKHEDVCSAVSIVFDPESPRCTAEGGHYLAQPEPAELDNSNDAEEANLHACFPELNEPGACSFEFPVGVEPALWPWPC